MQQDAIQTYFKYLPLNQNLLSWGFYVYDSGFAMIPKGAPYPPQQHPEDHYFRWERGRILPNYTLLYITEGEGEVETAAAGALTIRAGELLVVHPGQWHRYRPNRRTGWQEHWVEFSGDFATRMMKNRIFSIERPILRVGSDEVILKIYSDILEAIRGSHYGYEYWIAALTAQLIARLICITQSEDLVTLTGSIQQAQQLIVSHSGETIDLEALAKKVNMSYSLFRKRFKQYTGLSPHQFLIQVRLKRACQMLISSSLSVNEIAQALGFESVPYFFRIFKSKMKCTPSDYRQAHLASFPGVER